MSSFASGKFALRATGQSLAREFGPKGVHVAHSIVDGVIDIPRTKEWPVNGGVEDGKIDPDAVSVLCFYGGDRMLMLRRSRIVTGICIPSRDRTLPRNWIAGRLSRSSKMDCLERGRQVSQWAGNAME